MAESFSISMAKLDDAREEYRRYEYKDNAPDMDAQIAGKCMSLSLRDPTQI